MLNKIKKLFGLEKKKPERKPVPPSEDSLKPKKEEKPELTAKEIATLNNEPYINILKVELDPGDINNGSFELDWNDKFVINLIKAGYKQKNDDSDEVIVDRWFQTVCRNIALEIFEQQQADPTNRDLRVVRTRDIGNGRTEVS